MTLFGKAMKKLNEAKPKLFKLNMEKKIARKKTFSVTTLIAQKPHFLCAT